MIPRELDLTVNKYLSKKDDDTQEERFRKKYSPGVVPWLIDDEGYASHFSRKKWINRFHPYGERNTTTENSMDFGSFSISSSSTDSTFQLNGNSSSISFLNISFNGNSIITTNDLPNITTTSSNDNWYVYNRDDKNLYLRTNTIMTYEDNHRTKSGLNIEYEEEPRNFHFPLVRKIKKKYYKCLTCCNEIRYPYGYCELCQKEMLSGGTLTERHLEERIPWDEMDEQLSSPSDDERLPWAVENDKNLVNSRLMNETARRFLSSHMRNVRVPWDEEKDDDEVNDDVNVITQALNTFTTYSLNSISTLSNFM